MMIHISKQEYERIAVWYELLRKYAPDEVNDDDQQLANKMLQGAAMTGEFPSQVSTNPRPR